jgi:hypothetical protein
MEYLFGALVSWVVNNILNRFFFRARKIEQIIEVLEGRLAEKDKDIERLRKDQRKRVKERHHIVQALKRSGISADKLINKYDKPLNAILISYASQKELTPRGRLRESHFIRTELERYNVKYLGGSDSLIPPAKVPKNIKNSNDLKIWFDSEILKGRYCKLKFLVLLDLKKKAFWDSNLPYIQTRTLHHTLGEVLTIEDIFTEEQISKIALSDIVRSGDIAWLASDILSPDELEIIHKNQSLIEGELGNPSLRLLSNDDMVATLSTVLAKYGISSPDEVASVIVGEAKFWHYRLR